MSRPRQPPVSPVQEDDDNIEMDDEEMEFEDGPDLIDALGGFLATEDGDTIATTLVSLKDATEKIAVGIEMQNKILVKMLSAMGKMQCACACTTPQTA
jgi:hypothetical protein